ncbi:uncharacterized protein LOC131955589 [Physella acuta]|uniref:uncharacterized protein LOC131955589 n=1 Tax=Physella acuta TaxID=109671 RepID=UPI0027DB482C|nr:uncharacterized protein LOC131955589 [Physella acuta]
MWTFDKMFRYSRRYSDSNSRSSSARSSKSSKCSTCSETGLVDNLQLARDLSVSKLSEVSLKAELRHQGEGEHQTDNQDRDADSTPDQVDSFIPDATPDQSELIPDTVQTFVQPALSKMTLSYRRGRNAFGMLFSCVFLFALTSLAFGAPVNTEYDRTRFSFTLPEGLIPNQSFIEKTMLKHQTFAEEILLKQQAFIKQELLSFRALIQEAITPLIAILQAATVVVAGLAALNVYLNYRRYQLEQIRTATMHQFFQQIIIANQQPRYRRNRQMGFEV